MSEASKMPARIWTDEGFADVASLRTANAEQVAALRSKEQAAHEIAAAIRSGGGE